MAVLAGAWRRTYGSYGDDCRSLGALVSIWWYASAANAVDALGSRSGGWFLFYTLLKSLDGGWRMGEAYRGFWGGVLPFTRVEFLDSFAFLLFFRGKRRFFV